MGDIAASKTRFVPKADIYETQDSLGVYLEMPRVDKKRVSIRVEDGSDLTYIHPSTCSARRS